MTLRRRLQERLLNDGIPLYWFVDVPIAHPAFKCVQTLAQLGLPLGSDSDLFFHPERYIAAEDWGAWQKFSRVEVSLGTAKTRAEAAMVLYNKVNSLQSPDYQLT